MAAGRQRLRNERHHAGGAGNDTLSGGGGIDYTYLSGTMADYNFAQVTVGSLSGIQATHARNNSVVDDGTDLITTDTEFVVFLGDNTTVARTSLPLNAAPVLDAQGGGLSYTENDAATAINTLMTVSDTNNTNLTGATVSITANFVSGQDVLGFTNQNGITGTYNATTGVLTLTGTSSVANYQTALQSVRYSNTSENPSTSPRTVSFQVDDGQSTNHASNVVTATVSVTAVNDAPVLGGASPTLAYTENQTATAINTVLTVSDVDSTSITGATVSIGTNFSSGQDVLGFTDQNGITGTYSATTGVLTLTGSSSVANYQAALRSVTYSNTSENPSTATRTINFQVDDGSALNNTSNVATASVSVTAVNDAPVVNTQSSSLSYTENQVATAIATAITLSDADSANLAGATVSITSNFTAGQDVLGFTNQNGISGTYNATTGILTLTGSATVAQYQTALASVTYSNTSDNPSSATRTISYQVDDGSASNHASNVATATVSVTPVNDAPTGFNFVADANTIASGNGTGNIGAGQLLGTFVAVDADSSSFTYSLSGTNASSYTIGSTTGILSVGGSNLAGGTQHDINIVLSDGSASFSAPLHIEVLTTGGNNYAGTTGQDLIFGLNGNDTLGGGTGNDVIMGGGGGDSMSGGVGNDQLIGGAAQDTMSGGADADIFIFGTTAEAGTAIAGADVITDFDENQAGEFINVSFIDAQTGGGAPAGVQAFAFAGQNSSVVANSITWFQDAVNNRTVIQGDTNGNTTADFFIVLSGIHTLSAGDFVLS